MRPHVTSRPESCYGRVAVRAALSVVGCAESVPQPEPGSEGWPKWWDVQNGNFAALSLAHERVPTGGVAAGVVAVGARESCSTRVAVDVVNTQRIADLLSGPRGPNFRRRLLLHEAGDDAVRTASLRWALRECTAKLVGRNEGYGPADMTATPAGDGSCALQLSGRARAAAVDSGLEPGGAVWLADVSGCLLVTAALREGCR
eukprot:TRINITY_DN16936_c0_g1_i2.p2 TRINITY_DN16936_c0_g1~~TRINITY_DN16936_c0_g1_i2.p2  ORF type:complete len:202 (+),score=45.31 TRINITY_DN16936_c0_g1_i2:205-810(+)